MPRIQAAQGRSSVWPAPLLLAMTVCLAGCSANGWRAVAVGAQAIVVTARIAYAVHVLTNHDDHHHHESCGHDRRRHEGRWVYHYQQRWEYYDHESGTWYHVYELEDR